MVNHRGWLYKISLESLPLNSQNLSPVCSSLSQFAPVCPIYAQSQKLTKFHGVKSGSRFFGSSEPFLRVTVGHGKLRAATNGRIGIAKAESDYTNFPN